MKTKLLLILFLQFSFLQIRAQDNSLKNQIDTYLTNKKALVGVAIYDFDTKKSILINEKEHYPMQSVYKFHLALAVLNQVDKGKLALDKKILIKKEDLRPRTWSPMRKKYPEGNIRLPLSKVIDYSVAKSDNNACDILFRLVGGTKVVHQFIQEQGIKDISIKATEEEMHQDWDTQFTNWTSPKAMLDLLKKFYHKQILSKTSHDFLWKTMVNTSTGKDKIKGKLPKNAVVAHKTGMGPTSKKGIISADNDAGIIKLPNGKYFAIVVFVSKSKESHQTNAEIIADISLMTWNHFLKK